MDAVLEVDDESGGGSEVGQPAAPVVIARTLAWSPASLTDTVDAAAPAADHDRRRRSLAAAVRSAFIAA